MKKFSRSAIKIILVLLTLILFVIVGINIYMVFDSKDRIISIEEVEKYVREYGQVDTIEVLGAGIRNGWPSFMLQERLDRSFELLKARVSKSIIFSGDNGHEEYNEVMAMKNYALDKGVDEKNVVLDYAGFSTYDSIYRLKHVFKKEKVIIVTQKYHLYRALYIANKVGLNAYGIAAEDYKGGQFKRDIREIFARVKDFFYCIMNKQSKFL
ncbi:MAG: YdcF family protein [Clostridiales Family XIII bacterium]|jgi:vancomycin permeability regulator SanA|nr:YdcF family protein [Clostridiales Family XIII bacterium]